jgi:uncharacterized membrane protein YGL010W
MQCRFPQPQLEDLKACHAAALVEIGYNIFFTLMCPLDQFVLGGIIYILSFHMASLAALSAGGCDV